MHVHVPDIKATLDRAKRTGGTVVQKLARQDDGDYRGGISDGNDAYRWLSQRE